MELRLFYSTDFTGHWPVDTSAVVVAHNEIEARGLLDAELVKHKLASGSPYTLQELPLDTAVAIVLQDGDY